MILCQSIINTQFSDTDLNLRSYAKVAEIFEHLTEECAAEAWCSLSLVVSTWGSF